MYNKIMKVGILGSGDVGQALAKAFKSEGHEVMLATREPNSKKADEIAKSTDVKVVGFAEAAQFCELAVLATLWTGTESAIKLAGSKNLKDKIVIDVTNPLDFSAGMPPMLALGRDDSGGEQVQRWLEGSRVVKAFNSVGNQLMYKPQFNGLTPTMFYCGNDDSAKEVVKTILLSFGWEPADIGDITGARELEALCILWVKYGIGSGQWNHAFKLLT